MNETNTPKDPVVVDAAHRFPNAHDVPVVDESAPADVVPIHDAAQVRANEKAETFVGSLSDHPHMKAIEDHVDSPGKPDLRTAEEEMARRDTAAKVLARVTGIFGGHGAMKAAAEADKTREFNPSYGDQRRRHQRHGVTPDGRTN